MLIKNYCISLFAVQEEPAGPPAESSEISLSIAGTPRERPALWSPPRAVPQKNYTLRLAFRKNYTLAALIRMPCLRDICTQHP